MKTLSKYIAATAVVASLIGSAGFALAQTNSVPTADQTLPNKHFADRRAHHEQMIDKMFAKFDPGKTGAITIDAFLKGPDARFDKIDSKKQGYLDRDEVQAYFGARDPQLVDNFIKRLDTANDGKITKAEFEKPLRKRFALLDLNDDGKITREEAELAGPVMMPHEHGNWHHRNQINDQQPSAQ